MEYICEDCGELATPTKPCTCSEVEEESSETYLMMLDLTHN